MKVKFLKNHLDNKKGDIAEVETQRARYFINVGVAKEHKEEKKAPAKKKAEKVPVEDKSLKVDLENK